MTALADRRRGVLAAIDLSGKRLRVGRAPPDGPPLERHLSSLHMGWRLPDNRERARDRIMGGSRTSSRERNTAWRSKMAAPRSNGRPSQALAKARVVTHPRDITVDRSGWPAPHVHAMLRRWLRFRRGSRQWVSDVSRWSRTGGWPLRRSWMRFRRWGEPARGAGSPPERHAVRWRRLRAAAVGNPSARGSRACARMAGDQRG